MIFLLISARLSRCFTLFPYTTLFRSRAGRCADPADMASVAAQQARHHVAGGRDVLLPPECAPDVGTRGRDRKSTRLNSSHLVISYAVFCLKKNKGSSWMLKINILSLA